MSKRDRKEQKAAQLSKQNAIEPIHPSNHISTSLDSASKLTLASVVTDVDDQPTLEVRFIYYHRELVMIYTRCCCYCFFFYEWEYTFAHRQILAATFQQ
jgi:hypothetical protein